MLTAEQKGTRHSRQKSADLERARCDLKNTLDSAIEVVEKYTSDRFPEHVLEDDGHRDFESLNGSLSRAFLALSPNLQVDHNRQTKLEKMFSRDSQQEEDEADKKEDCEELQKSEKAGWGCLSFPRMRHLCTESYHHNEHRSYFFSLHESVSNFTPEIQHFNITLLIVQTCCS